MFNFILRQICRQQHASDWKKKHKNGRYIYYICFDIIHNNCCFRRNGNMPKHVCMKLRLISLSYTKKCKVRQCVFKEFASHLLH